MALKRTSELQPEDVLGSGGHHLTNIIYHSLNTLLLFWLFQRMTGKSWRSAAVAAMFAVHPMHVESVAWVAERKDVLSTFLGLLTLNVYVTYSRKAHFNATALFYSATLAACVAMLGWLWYNQCFWYLLQVRWFQFEFIRVTPSADVYERFPWQVNWLKHQGFTVSPDAYNWIRQQTIWLERTGLAAKGLPLAYDGLALTGRGLMIFGTASILALGAVCGFAYSSGRTRLLKYSGTMLGFVLVGLVILAKLWSVHKFGGPDARLWINWFGGAIAVLGIAGGAVAAGLRRNVIAVQCGVFAVCVGALLLVLNWLLVLPPQPPTPLPWNQSPFQTLVERMWCTEFVVAIFIIFGSLAVDAIMGRRANLLIFSAVFVLYALGLLAKPMLVTLPFVMLLMDFWPLGRLDLPKPREEKEKEKKPAHPHSGRGDGGPPPQ